jgi:pyruvate/2-oxoacid:ferredoxin oxidoreductase beta subunit
MEQQLKQWVILDNEIKNINNKLKELREKQKTIEKSLYEVPELENKVIQQGDEKLKIIKIKSYQSLTFGYLENVLSKIIKNESQYKIILDQIKNQREVKIVPIIKRF